MARRNFLVDLLAVFFGIGAWVSINGLWVELPLLVKELPEKWTLPSYMAIVIQFANIGPTCYALLRVFRPSTPTVPIIYAILATGCISSLLLTFLWDQTTIIGQRERSTALLSMIFFLGLVDCTSSVLYIPYMASWKEIYLSSYLIGEGLSGLFPALVALSQGVGGSITCENITHYNETTGQTIFIRRIKQPEPHFSATVFFFILFGMMLASCVAFVALEKYKRIQKERSSFNSKQAIEVASKDECMTKNTFIFLLVIQTWACFLANGLLPSIQSFSCGPYGSVPYHLAATLSTTANPLGAFCTMISPRTEPKKVALFCLIGTGLGVYIFIAALMSPTPPLVAHLMGSLIIVVVWGLFVGVITFVRVEIANLMREDGAQPLFWSGVVTQVGSAVGAVISFILVNKTSLFQYYDPCGLK